MTLTVKKLIEELQKFPPDMPVVFTDYESSGLWDFDETLWTENLLEVSPDIQARWRKFHIGYMREDKNTNMSTLGTYLDLISGEHITVPKFLHKVQVVILGWSSE